MLQVARTITSVNVQLGFQYEKFKQGVDGSINAWRNFNKIARDSVPLLDRYNEAIKNVNQWFVTHKGDPEAYARMIDQVNYSFKQGKYAIKEFSDEQKQYLADLKRGAELSIGTAERRQTEYNASVAEAERLQRVGTMSFEAYTKRIEELNKEYLGIATSAEKAAAAERELQAATAYASSVIASGMSNWDRYIAELNRFRDAAAKAGMGIREFAAGEAAVRKKFGIQTPDEFFEDQQLQLASEAADRLEKAVRRVDAAVLSGTSNWDRYQKELQQFQQDAALAGTGSQDIATGEAGIRKKFGILTSTEFFANQRKQEDDARKDRIAQLQRESMTFDEVAGARMKELDSLRAAGLDSETYWRQTRKLNDEMARQAGIISGGAGGVQGQSLTASLRSLGLQYYAVSQAMMAVSSGIRTVLNFERQTIAFASLTGSIEESSKMMEGFLELSAKAPLSITAMQGGARTMLSFGASAKEAGAAVEMIAKVTGGDEMRFQNMSLAFAQIRAGGRLMGQELRQMIDAGFNPLEQISNKTGMSMLDLRKRMEQGGISFDMVRQAMEEATSGGGRFARLLDDISGTMSGKLQRVIADINASLIDFSKMMSFDLGNIVDGVVSFVSIAKTISPVLAVVVKLTSMFSDGIQVVDMALKGWGLAFKSLQETIDSFLPSGFKLSDLFGKIASVFEYIAQLRQTEKLLDEPIPTPEETQAQKAADAYKALSDATQAASDATNEYYDELSGRFDEALKGSGKYTDAQLKIAEIESRGIKLSDAHKKGIVDRTAAIEKFEKQVRDAQQAMEKLQEEQEGMQDLMRELRPQDEAAKNVEEVIAQISRMDSMFGLENLGVTMDDIKRVVGSKAGAGQGDSLDYRLGEAVQSGSSAAIQKLYDFQVKQDTSEILTDISQTSRDQLDLLRQKLEGGVVLAGARP
ncbi:MAG: tape measure protein [Bacteroidota bacterium]